MVTRGYPSISYLYEAAQVIREVGKPAFLYYFVDYDPSGIDIPRVVEERIREFAPASEIYFEIVAVTPEQIDDWGLPTRPTKAKDTRIKGFQGESVEVDAIPPGDLRELIWNCIVNHIDERALEVMQAAEHSERQVLNRIIGDVIHGQQGIG